MDISKKRGFSTSSFDSGGRPDVLDLDFDGLPCASPETAEALERNRPGPISLEEYARCLMRFSWTEEQLRAIPLATGLPRFTLD